MLQTQIMQRVTKTQSSNLASVTTAIEDDDSKVANISTDVAFHASQMASSGSDLTAASAVRAKGYTGFQRV